MRVFTGIAIVAFGLTGCATQPYGSSIAQVSPDQFSHYGCEQLVTEMKDVNLRANETYYDLKEEERIDAVHKAIGGAVFIWPTIIVLDNKDLFFKTELTRLKEEHVRQRWEWKALKDTAIMKKCDMAMIPKYEWPKPVEPTRQSPHSVKL